MEQQIAAVLDETEVHSKRTTVCQVSADRVVFRITIGQPYLARAPQTYAAVKRVHILQFRVLLELFGCDINIAAHECREGAQRFLIPASIRHDLYGAI